MINVLDLVKQEDMQEFTYPDEKIASSLYYVSFSSELKALEGMKDALKAKKSEENEWLKSETDTIADIPVLNFDRIVGKLKSGRCSCDALFCNIERDPGEQHYLAEFKRAGKETVLKLMSD